MVEEWNVGDEFEVIKDVSDEWLTKGERGVVYSLSSSTHLYFSSGQSIQISRIKKITTKNYELW